MNYIVITLFIFYQFPVSVTDIRKDKIRDENSYNESSPGKASVLHEESSTSRDIDPGLVFDFVQKLTCISSRSKEVSYCS